MYSKVMEPIADTESLAAFCDSLKTAEFITVDTEFVRERTYWPQLCLVQVGGPDEARAIDALAEGLDLGPLYDLLTNPKVLKVFHAARQDIEIVLHMSGHVPTPLFDTQIAAMVCGFGDSVSYEVLASQLAKARIDKSMRFTDWTQRPLIDRQLHYALADVTHLRIAYEKLRKMLDRNGRLPWLEQEMTELTDPATYRVAPEESWRRLKPRSTSPRYLAVLREVAAWREREAREKDLPRQRVIRDETLSEIAAHTPTTVAELGRVRGLGKAQIEGALGAALLKAVGCAMALPEDLCPHPRERADLPKGIGPVIDLLKVLLKLKCDEHDVAQKLIASSADLEMIAADDEADVPALHGWRRELFGDDALRLKHGRIALGLAPDGKRLRMVPLDEPATPAHGVAEA